MTTTTTPTENVHDKFVAAWDAFAATCAQSIAPELPYQAWFAHYLITRFGIDRVARQPMIKKTHFTDTALREKFAGDHVRLDVVVMRQPGVHLPHYASRIDRATDGTGLVRLQEMAVISELKVTATQWAARITQRWHAMPTSIRCCSRNSLPPGVPDERLPLP
jgi:hypothetical protein